MAAVVATRPPAQMSSPRTDSSSSATPSSPLSSINTSQRGTPAAIPHKHIPYCSPGPRPSQLNTPPASPPSPTQLLATSSTTYPPAGFPQLSTDPPIYGISAQQLALALEHLATQPLPPACQVFPWLHGLHAENHLQLAFFIGRKRSLRRTPPCLRGLTVVKARGDLSCCKLKGAVAPEELLQLAPPQPQRKSPTSPPRFSASSGKRSSSSSSGNSHGHHDPEQEEEDPCDFIDIDPRDGFSVRNFQIQACKMATVSDIVVYGDMETPRFEVEALAARFARAQAAWQRKLDPKSTTSSATPGERLFNTFVLTDNYDFIETDHPDLVALDSDGCMTTKVMDFFHWERLEMYSMSAPTEISHNVWLGPTPDASLTNNPFTNNGSCGDGEDDGHGDYDFMIEATDLAQVPDANAFRLLENLLERKASRELARGVVPQLEFPGSGAILPPTWSQGEVDGLMATCEWIYAQAHHAGTTITTTGGSATSSELGLKHLRRDSKLSLTPDSHPSNSNNKDADGDSLMPDAAAPAASSETPPTGRKILIHCNDGYTESSLLALAYYMYAEGASVHEAWLALHREKDRNFFAYASDVALLRAIQPRILMASPKLRRALSTSFVTEGSPGPSSGDSEKEDEDQVNDNNPLSALLCPPVPEWLDKMDGSLPSRILDYMYLGNLGHANNPGLLKELGIGQILSVGEPVSWSAEVRESWAKEDLLYVNRVQDNGVDPLMEEFGRCLEFIESGRRKGTATLVHCRVGVSRSATICIAEVMSELGLSFPRAYCFVRARRLNVIIQPHLRFCYELLKWEEIQCEKRGRPLRRELEWATIAHEIAAMNRPYSKQ